MYWRLLTNPAGSDNLPLYVDVGFEKYQRSELAEGDTVFDFMRT